MRFDVWHEEGDGFVMRKTPDLKAGAKAGTLRVRPSRGGYVWEAQIHVKVALPVGDGHVHRTLGLRDAFSMAPDVKRAMACAEGAYDCLAALARIEHTAVP